MNLESTAEALRAWTPSKDVNLELRERRLERFGQFAFGGFGVVLILAVLGIIYTILTKMVLTGQQALVGILLIAFLVFAILTLAYVIFKEDLKEKRMKTRPATPQELESPVTGKLLEENQFEPVPAITEHTTDLLPVRERER